MWYAMLLMKTELTSLEVPKCANAQRTMSCGTQTFLAAPRQSSHASVTPCRCRLRQQNQTQGPANSIVVEIEVFSPFAPHANSSDSQSIAQQTKHLKENAINAAIVSQKSEQFGNTWGQARLLMQTTCLVRQCLQKTTVTDRRLLCFVSSHVSRLCVWFGIHMFVFGSACVYFLSCVLFF